jgi:hypothetical protein
MRAAVDLTADAVSVGPAKQQPRSRRASWHAAPGAADRNPVHLPVPVDSSTSRAPRRVDDHDRDPQLGAAPGPPPRRIRDQREPAGDRERAECDPQARPCAPLVVPATSRRWLASVAARRRGRPPSPDGPVEEQQQQRPGNRDQPGANVEEGCAQTDTRSLACYRAVAQPGRRASRASPRRGRASRQPRDQRAAARLCVRPPRG